MINWIFQISLFVTKLPLFLVKLFYFFRWINSSLDVLVVTRTAVALLLIPRIPRIQYRFFQYLEKDAFSGPYFPVFSPNTGKCGPVKTPYLDTFHVVTLNSERENVKWNLLIVTIKYLEIKRQFGKKEWKKIQLNFFLENESPFINIYL